MAVFQSSVDSLEGIVQNMYESKHATFRTVIVSKPSRYKLFEDAITTVEPASSNSSAVSVVSNDDLKSISYSSGYSSLARILPRSSDITAALRSQVVDSNGITFSFQDVLQHEGKTIVIAIRHFWCQLCLDYVSYIADLPFEELKDRNIKIVLIGCGSHELIEKHRSIHGLMIEFYTNPTRDFYKALGMFCSYNPGKDSSKGEYIKHSMYENVIASAKNGMHMRKWPGSMSQLGGEACFDVQGDVVECLYLNRMTNTRDHGMLNDLLRVADCQVPKKP